jgi:hypothetical protein
MNRTGTKRLRITLNAFIRMHALALNVKVIITKVTLSRPARVCPRRSDKSSVAKARSYTFVSSSLPPAKDRTVHTLSRGTIARNEPIDGLEGNRT